MYELQMLAQTVAENGATGGWDGLHPLVRVIIISGISGIVGTVIGGLLGVIVKRPSRMYIGLMLALGSGAMLGMSIFEMMPHSFEYVVYEDYGGLHWGIGVLVVVLGVAAGCAAVFGLSKLVDHLKRRRQKKLAACSCEGDENILYEGECADERGEGVIRANDSTANAKEDTENTLEEAESTAVDVLKTENSEQTQTGENDNLIIKNDDSTAAVMTDKKKETIENLPAAEKRKLLTLGLIVFMAIVLHDLPEGMAIGAGEHIGIGLAIGAMMLLHNIPEGFAIAIPLKASGVKIWKIIGLCALAGAPALLGGIIGWALADINDIFAATILAFAAGAMMYVVFKDMLPTAYKYTKKRHAITTVCLVVGILLMVLFSAALH